MKKKRKKQSSQKVKDWRARQKAKIVAAMGGKCQGCGYNRTVHALQLHHPDPSKKEFSFSWLRRNPKAAVKQIEELQKCVLVCANCHYEIHGGVIQNPPSFFDEVMYRTLIKKSEP